MSWDQKFYDPIPLPDGKPLVTLRDTALHITKLPKAGLLTYFSHANNLAALGRYEFDASRFVRTFREWKDLSENGQVLSMENISSSTKILI